MIFNDSEDKGLDLDNQAIKAWITMNPPNLETWTYTQDFQPVNG